MKYWKRFLIQAVLSALVILSFVWPLKAQFNLNQSYHLSGTSEKSILSMVADADHNLIIVGFFSDTVNFDAGQSDFSLISNGVKDAFIAKYDNQGGFIWAIAMGGTDDDYCKAVSTDSVGNVFVTGVYRQSVDFDPGDEVYNLVNTVFWNNFIAKYDANGNFQFAFDFGQFGNDGRSIVAVPSGGFLVAGQMVNLGAYFNPNDLADLTLPMGSDDAYVCKYSSDGDYLWHKTFGSHADNSNFHEKANSVTLDQNENIILAGTFIDTLILALSTPDTLLCSNEKSTFLISLDQSGNINWGQRICSFYSNSKSDAYSVCVDYENDILLAGKATNFLQFTEDSEFQDFPFLYYNYISKWSDQGSFIWAIPVIDKMADGEKSLATDLQNSIFCTGAFGGFANYAYDFDPGPDSSFFYPKGFHDTYVIKFDHNGFYKSGFQLGGNAFDTSIDHETGKTLLIDQNELFVAGMFADTMDVDLDSNSVTNLYSAASYWNTDAYVASYSFCQDYFNDSTIFICSGDSLLIGDSYVSEEGVFTDVFYSALGCDSSINFNVFINPLPQVNLGNDTLLCAEESMALNAGEGYLFYEWSTGLQDVPSIQIDSTGIGIGSEQIYVLVTDSNLCMGSDTISIGFDICESVNEKASDSHFKITPNPSSGHVLIEIYNMKSLKVWNSEGQLVEFFDNLSQTLNLNLSLVPKGVYILEIITDQGRFRKRLILK